MAKSRCRLLKFRLRTAFATITIITILFGIAPTWIGPYDHWIDYLFKTREEREFDALIELIQTTIVPGTDELAEQSESKLELVKQSQCSR